MQSIIFIERVAVCLVVLRQRIRRVNKKRPAIQQRTENLYFESKTGIKVLSGTTLVRVSIGRRHRVGSSVKKVLPKVRVVGKINYGRKIIKYNVTLWSNVVDSIRPPNINTITKILKD